MKIEYSKRAVSDLHKVSNESLGRFRANHIGAAVGWVERARSARSADIRAVTPVFDGLWRETHHRRVAMGSAEKSDQCPIFLLNPSYNFRARLDLRGLP
jgi:hypothetical protein